MPYEVSPSPVAPTSTSRLWTIGATVAIAVGVMLGLAVIHPQLAPWLVGGAAVATGAAWLLNAPGRQEVEPVRVDDGAAAVPAVASADLLDRVFEALEDPVLIVSGGEPDDIAGRRIVLANQAARDLLRRPGIAPWVLYKLDGGIDHILIDEAQDTNPEQWEVIEALAGEFFTGEGARALGRTVFAVGDTKQSIYSFQRADPRAFVRLRGDLSARAAAVGQLWTNEELIESFRSTEAVLGAIDAVFAQEIAAKPTGPLPPFYWAAFVLSGDWR